MTLNESQRPNTRKVLAVCPHDCPDTCSMIAHVENDRLIRVEGNPEHPFTRGHLCRKVAHYEERVYSADRLQFLMRRSGQKGSGEFARISWDEALDEVAQRWKGIIEE